MNDTTAARRVSVWDVACSDVLGNVAAWLLGFVPTCTLALLVYAQVTGHHPKESWLEIASGVTLISAALVLFIQYRGSRVMRRLEKGERAPARVEAHRSVDQWVWLTLTYRPSEADGPVTRRVLLPSTRRTRALGERDEVEVAYLRGQSNRPIITALYERQSAT